MQCVVDDGCRESAPDNLGLCRGHWLWLPPLVREMYWLTFGDGQMREDQADRGYDEAVKQSDRWMEENTSEDGGRYSGDDRPSVNRLYQHLSMLGKDRENQPTDVPPTTTPDTISESNPANSGGSASEGQDDGTDQTARERWDAESPNAHRAEGAPGHEEGATRDARPRQDGNARREGNLPDR